MPCFSPACDTDSVLQPADAGVCFAVVPPPSSLSRACRSPHSSLSHSHSPSSQVFAAVRAQHWYRPGPDASTAMIRALGAAGQSRVAVAFFNSLSEEEGGVGVPVTLVPTHPTGEADERSAAVGPLGGGDRAVKRVAARAAPAGDDASPEGESSWNEHYSGADGSMELPLNTLHSSNGNGGQLSHGPATALVAALVRDGDLTGATAVLGLMRGTGMQRIDVALQILAQAMEQAGQIREAENLKEEREGVLRGLGGVPSPEPWRTKKKFFVS